MADTELSQAGRNAFNQAVWKVARQIPTGKVSTYGQLGNYIPCPQDIAPDTYQAFRARWVGSAMAACPDDVPWQRVINSQGKISPRPGAETQRRLLEKEGVVFDDRGRVDLKKFSWSGPPVDWLRANGLIAPDEPEQLGLF